MYLRTIAVLLLAVAAMLAVELGWLIGHPPAPRRARLPPPGPVWPIDADVNDEALLGRRVGRVELTDASVDAAVDAVRQSAGVNIVDLTRSTHPTPRPGGPVTLRLSGMSVRAALRNIFRQAELSPDFTTRDGVIVIGGRPQEIVRVYNVRALVEARWPPAAAPAVEPVRDPREAQVRGGGEQPIEQLRKMILAEIAKDSWFETRVSGRIWDWNGVFVISQTPEVHEKIARFLRTLQRATTAPAATAPSTNAPTTAPARPPA